MATPAKRPSDADAADADPEILPAAAPAEAEAEAAQEPQWAAPPKKRAKALKQQQQQAASASAAAAAAAAALDRSSNPPSSPPPGSSPAPSPAPVSKPASKLAKAKSKSSTPVDSPAPAKSKASSSSTKKASGSKKKKQQLTQQQPEAREDEKHPPSSPKYEQEEEDDGVYCICQTRYNADRNMIMCDRCDQWYHNMCMGIKDEETALVDLFICPPCEPSTTQRTTWKEKCRRTSCLQAAQTPLSRYCSERCGILTVSDRMVDLNIRALEADPRVQGATKLGGVVTWTHALDREAWSALFPSPESSLYHLRQRKAAITESLNELDARAALLDQIMDATPQGRDDPCGFDDRLTLGPHTPHPTVCQIPRRRCKRHVDWSNIKEAEIDAERNSRAAALAHIEDEEQALQSRLDSLRRSRSVQVIQEPPTPQDVKPIQSETPHQPPLVGR